jgi:hypothetical protein
VNDLEKILSQINEKRLRMAELWDKTGKTDQEILGVSIEIDKLLNEYYRLL